MRRIVKAAPAVAMCLLILASCAKSQEFSADEKLSGKYTRNSDPSVTYNYADGAEEPPNSYTNFANGALEFELKQFRNIAKTDKDGFVFCPANAALSIAMTANAASSDTRQEILLALDNSAGLDELNTCASYFKSRMETVGAKGGSGNSVTLGGAMLISDSIDVKSSFLQSEKDFYGYDVFRFDTKGENAEKKLSNYLPKGTDVGGVEFKNGSLDLISFSELSDGWLEQYTDDDVYQGELSGSGGKTGAAFLCSEESKIETDSAVGVIKYTANNPLKLVMVMPKDGKAFDKYVSGFTGDEFTALMDSVDITKKSTFYIPEFSVESGKKAESRAGVLTSCGLYSLFSEKAGFSALSYTESAAMGDYYEVTPGFSLTKDGINKSAELLGNSESLKALSTEKDAVVFDRPFIYLLIDNESNLPVYAGIYR